MTADNTKLDPGMTWPAWYLVAALRAVNSLPRHMSDDALVKFWVAINAAQPDVWEEVQ